MILMFEVGANIDKNILLHNEGGNSAWLLSCANTVACLLGPKILLVTLPTFKSLRKQTFSLLFYGITMANHPSCQLHLLSRWPSVCFPWSSSLFLAGDPISSIHLLITSSICIQTIFDLHHTGFVTRWWKIKCYTGSQKGNSSTFHLKLVISHKQPNPTWKSNCCNSFI